MCTATSEQTKVSGGKINQTVEKNNQGNFKLLTSGENPTMGENPSRPWWDFQPKLDSYPGRICYQAWGNFI